MRQHGVIDCLKRELANGYIIAGIIELKMRAGYLIVISSALGTIANYICPILTGSLSTHF